MHPMPALESPDSDAGTQEVMVPGHLTLAATPIGNPLDASVRLIRALREADVIAAEDTRRLKRLATDVGVRIGALTWAYHEHNEREKTPQLISEVLSGKKVLLVTDAGMPVISDPGFRAVAAAHKSGIPVDVLPGPSAVLTALVHSGLAPERFTFEGFAPRTSGKLERFFMDMRDRTHTSIFFESPRRVGATLATMARVVGDEREACLARELTKTYEQVRRGSVGDLAAWAGANHVRGEIVIVLGPSTGKGDADALVHEVHARVARGERLRDAAKAVAASYRDVSARDLYERARVDGAQRN